MAAPYGGKVKPFVHLSPPEIYLTGLRGIQAAQKNPLRRRRRKGKRMCLRYRNSEGTARWFKTIGTDLVLWEKHVHLYKETSLQEENESGRLLQPRGVFVCRSRVIF